MPKRYLNIDWNDFRYVLAIARRGTVSSAARYLGVDHATVVRRISRLEQDLAAKLFERRKTGYILTDAGRRIAESAESIESTVIADQSAVGDSRAHLSGAVRIGAPDGFGSAFLAPRLVSFADQNPDLEVQLVATAHVFSLSQREADIAISLALPKEGRIVGRKLIDYRLRLYAAPDYLARFPAIKRREDLLDHRFVGYIDDLLYTPELAYLPQISSKIRASFCSANIIAQFNATVAGYGIAVLPCFMAEGRPDLVPVLSDSTAIMRSFWLLMHADSKDLARIRAAADFIYEVTEQHRALFDPEA